MKVIGIDPGLATTGYGIIEFKKGKQTPFSCIKYGMISTEANTPTATRLLKLHKETSLLLKEYHPDLMMIENLFFFKNIKTAFPVSQARGVILLAAAENEIPVKEITPPQVKAALTGNGRADKKQIQETIKVLLSLKEIPKPDDVADALAIAICSSGLSL